jgi:2,3-bisphosphoglycerate-dependent phosphoglycerate mutase
LAKALLSVKKGVRVTKKTFYLFRHGQTDWNKQRRIQGHTDIPLNDQGRQEAAMLADKLCNIEFDCIYSSDLMRAKETAEIVIAKRQIPLIVTSQLRETHMGQAEGLSVDEAIERFGLEKWNSFRDTSDAALKLGFPDGETRGDSLKRLMSFFEECVREDDSLKIIGLSTHGGALRSLLHSFLPDHTQALPIPNCVVYKLQQIGGIWKVEGPLN